jgi:hypothetical protein
MMQRLLPMPTHAAATGRRTTHSEKTRISQCIMMRRWWTTPTRVIVVVRRRKPLAGKRNFACIIMRRFWTTASWKREMMRSATLMVIPGLAKREPGTHGQAPAVVTWVPGSTLRVATE